MKSRLVAPIATLALSIAASAQHELLGIDYVTSTLWDVDPVTGACSNPRGVAATYPVGLAGAPDGTLYALTTYASIPPNSLIEINPVTGAYSLVGNTGLTSIFEGDLAFDPTTGDLYGIQNYVGYQYWFFTLSLSTGAATLIGMINIYGIDLSGMAFDAAGNCFVLDTNLEHIIQIDKTSGYVQSFAPLSVSLGEVAGMDFDPITGDLYVVDGYTGATKNLYTCDPNTGAMTLVGPTGSINGFSGLAFRGNIPASATFRNDAGGTNPTGYSASAPVLGATWDASVDNTGMSNTLAGVVGHLSPLQFYLPGPDDWLLVNIADLNGELMGLGVKAGAGVVGFSVPIPGDAALCGFAAFTQGFGMGGGGGINLHNAYDLILGTS